MEINEPVADACEVAEMTARPKIAAKILLAFLHMIRGSQKSCAGYLKFCSKKAIAETFSIINHCSARRLVVSKYRILCSDAKHVAQAIKLIVPRGAASQFGPWPLFCG